MTTIIRIIVTSFLLCGLFASLVFLSKLSAAIFGFHSLAVTRIGTTSEWSLENYLNFTPGFGNRVYRQETYSKATHHHNRHLHQFRKFRISKSSNTRTIPLKVVCYLTIPSAGWPTLNPQHVNGSLCTHIIIGFAHISNASLLPFTPEDEMFYQETVKMKKDYPHLKIMLSVGGGKTGGFQEVISNISKREEFAVSSAKYLKAMELDGIDIDWEFPGNITAFICIFFSFKKKLF